ncbi:carbohydrate ABC transporter permease [Kribbella italica]|uniref:Multiple sugar transport system permease protein n=1 Tax=Kribbella italica TaxID=1540520 RepID=A0A7W9J5F6_9ACTN|nr:carbohydrate ABC transporter permease [Kribbella italica]MBB5835734.1 multiple sugar transport system permease protein [Kribbella italica]
MTTFAPTVQHRLLSDRTLRRRRLLGWIAHRSVLLALVAMFVTPLVFAVLTAVMTDQQALTSRLLPNPVALGNFGRVFESIPLIGYTVNTLQYAVLSTLGVVVSSVPAAYALARFQWRGQRLAMVLVLAMMMLPLQITVVPLYVMYGQLGWLGALAPLIVPSFFGHAFSIFLLRQFLVSIPQDYAEAARIDGASEWRIMTRVILPMAKPAVAAVALFHFMYCWNDLFGPLLYTSENESFWTLSMGLAAFKTSFGVQWNLTLAATLLFMAPVLLLFLAAQRVFVEGVSLTGVKG